MSTKLVLPRPAVWLVVAVLLLMLAAAVYLTWWERTSLTYWDLESSPLRWLPPLLAAAAGGGLGTVLMAWLVGKRAAANPPQAVPNAWILPVNAMVVAVMGLSLLRGALPAAAQERYWSLEDLKDSQLNVRYWAQAKGMIETPCPVFEPHFFTHEQSMCFVSQLETPVLEAVLNELKTVQQGARPWVWASGDEAGVNAGQNYYFGSQMVTLQSFAGLDETTTYYAAYGKLGGPAPTLNAPDASENLAFNLSEQQWARQAEVLDPSFAQFNQYLVLTPQWEGLPDYAAWLDRVRARAEATLAP